MLQDMIKMMGDVASDRQLPLRVRTISRVVSQRMMKLVAVSRIVPAAGMVYLPVIRDVENLGSGDSVSPSVRLHADHVADSVRDGDAVGRNRRGILATLRSHERRAVGIGVSVFDR